MLRSVGISLAFASVALTGVAFAETPNGKVPVTVDNFIRAETDHYLAANAKDVGGLGKFQHSREPVPID
ncbi:carboxylesterase, partial [Agrobacterium sp. MCAB5]